MDGSSECAEVRGKARSPIVLPVSRHNAPSITADEFERFRKWILAAAGIHLSAHKRALVMGRLAGRIRARGFGSYGEYLDAVLSEDTEHDLAVDLLTTNETHFFREPRHFDFLAGEAPKLAASSRTLRIWSAACSTGEEPYSIAMTLASALPERSWEVLGSDISQRVLARARTGHYTMARARGIPLEHLRAYCLKGVGEQADTLLVDPALRGKVEFRRVNLNETPPELPMFDVIFLRNVMIYFDARTKKQVVARLANRLRPGGYLLVGHSESLNGINGDLRQVRPSIYSKP